MKIENYDDLKFTSLKYGIDIIHFKYKGEHYTLENGGTDYTQVTHLYKGRTKYNLEHIKGCYGADFNLIKYKNNKKVLSAIDKENFVIRLVKLGILDGTNEQLEKIKEEKKASIQQQIDRLKRDLKDLDGEEVVG